MQVEKEAGLLCMLAAAAKSLLATNARVVPPKLEHPVCDFAFSGSIMSLSASCTMSATCFHGQAPGPGYF